MGDMCIFSGSNLNWLRIPVQVSDDIAVGDAEPVREGRTSVAPSAMPDLFKKLLLSIAF